MSCSVKLLCKRTQMFSTAQIKKKPSNLITTLTFSFQSSCFKNIWISISSHLYQLYAQLRLPCHNLCLPPIMGQAMWFHWDLCTNISVLLTFRWFWVSVPRVAHIHLGTVVTLTATLITNSETWATFKSDMKKMWGIQ